MPDGRPVWPDPAAGAGLGKADQILRNRQAHQDLMREELELEHHATEGRERRPGLLARLKARVSRA